MNTIDRTISPEILEKVLLDGEHISLSKAAGERIAACYEFLKTFSADKIIYGINTGFGPMAQYRVEERSLKALQYNIIRSHATGAGSPLPDLYVRAAMTARLGTFIQARSGVSLEMVSLLVECINRGIYPLIPEHGGVGASGDLVQLAHLALVLIGEGEVHYNNEWRPAMPVLEENNLKPFDIHIREGLSITNGTSVMTGIGMINVLYSRRLLRWAVLASVWINEITSSYDDSFSAELNAMKLHPGQRAIALMMREIGEGSAALQKREDTLYNNVENGGNVFTHKVQPYYSIRCVPQILGPVADALLNAETVVVNEINSVCDNPVVDPDSRNVYHGGNFHGDYISYEMDKLKIGIAKLTMLMERQLNYLCHDRVNGILPAFLNMGIPGLNYGLQATQFTATSTTAESQTLAMPMSIHSIPCNNDNQDIVSMGTNSALLTKTVIENAFQVTSIHLMALAQATDCLSAKNRLSPRTREIYEQVRSIFPEFVEDVPQYPTIESLKKHIMNTVI
ncbi:MAG: aromatic amino acid ammonia-lyase [Tannerellaceae bacterium]|jgi:histidine ammonia-lyase|nr:aromatic amino acid ammonia-lyase [Tannerellaceae bacterium]